MQRWRVQMGLLIEQARSINLNLSHLPYKTFFPFDHLLPLLKGHAGIATTLTCFAVNFVIYCQNVSGNSVPIELLHLLKAASPHFFAQTAIANDSGQRSSQLSAVIWT